MTILRIAEKQDAERLAELAEGTFREAFAATNTPENMDLHCRSTYSRAIQEQEILDPSLTTVVCVQEGQFVGYLQLRWGPPPQPSTAARPMEIQRLYVARPWHGRGVAQELMTEALARAERGKADLVWLGVWEHNPRAQAFYRKFEFVEAGDHVFPVGHDPQRDLIMVRNLGPS